MIKYKRKAHQENVDSCSQFRKCASTPITASTLLVKHRFECKNTATLSSVAGQHSVLQGEKCIFFSKISKCQPLVRTSWLEVLLNSGGLLRSERSSVEEAGTLMSQSRRSYRAAKRLGGLEGTSEMTGRGELTAVTQRQCAPHRNNYTLSWKGSTRLRSVKSVLLSTTHNDS